MLSKRWLSSSGQKCRMVATTFGSRVALTRGSRFCRQLHALTSWTYLFPPVVLLSPSKNQIGGDKSGDTRGGCTLESSRSITDGDDGGCTCIYPFSISVGSGEPGMPCPCLGLGRRMARRGRTAGRQSYLATLSCPFTSSL